MRLAVFDDYQVGVAVSQVGIVDVSACVESRWRGTRYVMNHVIEDFEDRYRAKFDDVVHTSKEVIAVDRVSLRAPSPSPLNLIALPLNYHAHINEMVESKHVGKAFVPNSARELGFFMKSGSSICGEAGPIELPNLPGRRFDHEAELAIFIGREARGLAEQDALGAVFGYSCLLDITMRNSECITNERAMRKSFESFTPIGPTVVTKDEVPDAGNLSIELRVNGQPRQAARTSQLIVGISEIVAMCSQVMTLTPGDVIATGTPAGVGPIVPGDVVHMEIENIGSMTKKVASRSW